MPPRYSYWTIILNGTATSFRSATRDELIPTLYQLKKLEPKAVLKWFARGQLWESPSEARAAAQQRRSRTRTGAKETSRDRNWRPGGTHRDPKARTAGRKKVTRGHRTNSERGRPKGGKVH